MLDLAIDLVKIIIGNLLTIVVLGVIVLVVARRSILG